MNQHHVTQRHLFGDRLPEASVLSDVNPGTAHGEGVGVCGLILAGVMGVALVLVTGELLTGGLQAKEPQGEQRGFRDTIALQALPALDDGALERIRGRYVDPQALGEKADFVILWDERPRGGSGAGSDSRRSISSGNGNQQSSRVTTQRRSAP